MTIRSMTDDDLDAVYEIELASFSDPWIRDFFVEAMRQDAYVAVRDGKIVGYICAMRVEDECSIINLAVRPELRRQGIAEFMLRSLFNEVDSRGVRFCYLEVRAANQAALALYEKFGFTKVGRRRAYYRNPVEDAVVMAIDRKRDNEGQ